MNWESGQKKIGNRFRR